MSTNLPFKRVHIPTPVQARSKLGIATQKHAPEAEIAALRHQLAASKVAQAIEREAGQLDRDHALYLADRLTELAEQAPPLTDDQVSLLRPLLRPLRTQGPLA